MRGLIVASNLSTTLIQHTYPPTATRNARTLDGGSHRRHRAARGAAAARQGGQRPCRIPRREEGGGQS